MLKNAVSRGIVSTEADLHGERFLQLGASVNSGNSGGPALNARGEVIGVVTASAAEREAIGFCIPVEDVLSALRKAGALSRDRVATAEKMHNIESIARRIRRANSIYARAILKYLDSMLKADREGGSLRQAFLDTRREIGPGLTEINQQLADSLTAEVKELVADPDLAFPVRRDLEWLWDAFVSRRRFAESPPEDFRSFMAAMDQTEARLNERLDRMARTLGTELDD